MILKPSGISPEISENAYWFVFKETQLLIDSSKDQLSIPKFMLPHEKSIFVKEIYYLGKIDSICCFCAEMVNEQPPPSFETKDLRLLFNILDKDIFIAANKALQIVNWSSTHKYCGRCGALMKSSPFEFSKICPDCGLTQYPRISPAIIVAIVNKDRILLARRTGSTMYSVIAGYVEAGENLEETVLRETQEEVGIKVKNIRYFSSQPWAFSYSLMVAFTADYDNGEILPDGKEIEEANWFTADELPERIPGSISIARALIEWFKNTFSAK